MAHSHLLVQHLLKQLEQHKQERPNRQRRPDWLSAFVHQAAALFEPLAGVGRVGSECEVVDGLWQARLYLGATEIVGGKEDGRSQCVSFELDVDRISQLFTRIDKFAWTVSGCSANSSFLTMHGDIDEHQICLKIYSRPPRDAGPAFLQHSDGSRDTVSS